MQKWLPLPGFESSYVISQGGEIFSLKLHRNMKIKTNRGGYGYIDLCKNKVKRSATIHRLVAITFIKNELSKPCINHKDGNKLNNQISNLEWCTHSENIIHAYKTGLKRADKKHNGRWKGKL